MRNRHVGLVVAMAATLVLTSGPAFADINGVLTNIVSLLTGGVTKSLATIAVIFTGLAWMFGYLDMRKAAYVVLGCAVVFGATQVVSTLTS